MTDYNSPTSPAEARFSPETQLTPEAMFKLSEELLARVGTEFPVVGDISVAWPANPSEGFRSGKKAQALYVPTIGDRPFFDPSRSGKDDPNPKDFATWFMQAAGKTFTMRIRGERPEPDDLQHAKVPKITKQILSAKSDEERVLALHELNGVVAHNLGLPVEHPDVQLAMRAHTWMIDRLSARLVPSEVA